MIAGPMIVQMVTTPLGTSAPMINRILVPQMRFTMICEGTNSMAALATVPKAASTSVPCAARNRTASCAGVTAS